MRTSNSLPIPEQPSPKLCYSSTSPARISDVDCEPGPSTQSDEESSQEVASSANSDEPKETIEEPTTKQEPATEPNEEKDCKQVEDLDFESWV